MKKIFALFLLFMSSDAMDREQCKGPDIHKMVKNGIKAVDASVQNSYPCVAFEKHLNGYFTKVWSAEKGYDGTGCDYVRHSCSKSKCGCLVLSIGFICSVSSPCMQCAECVGGYCCMWVLADKFARVKTKFMEKNRK